MHLATWKSDLGNPLVEQFRVAGLGGDDRIGFVAGVNALDVVILTERSRDWAGYRWGPGDDISGSVHATGSTVLVRILFTVMPEMTYSGEMVVQDKVCPMMSTLSMAVRAMMIFWVVRVSTISTLGRMILIAAG